MKGAWFCKAHRILGVQERLRGHQHVHFSSPTVLREVAAPAAMSHTLLPKNPGRWPSPPAAHSKVMLLTRAWFSRVQPVVSGPVTAQARAWGRCSENDVLPSCLPQSPCKSRRTLPAGWDHRRGAVVQRQCELEENCKTGSPSSQMGKVRPRQDLPKVQNFPTHVGL